MFGSVVLEVTVGIIFIYLLYSLLATIIMEIIASFLDLRARNLRNAISRMLDNNSDSYRLKHFKLIQYFHLLWSGIRQFFVPYFGKPSILFYKQPLIQLLREGRFFNKPSYLSSSQFSQTLMGLFYDHASGNTMAEKLDNSLLDPENKIVSDTTKKHLQFLWEKADKDVDDFVVEVELWFDNTMERAKGWYKRDSQAILLVIGLALAVIFNASTVDLVNLLAKDKDARAQMVQLAEAYIDNNNSGTGFRAADSVKLDSLLAIQKQLQTDVKEANSVLGFGWNAPSTFDAQLITRSEWENIGQNQKYGRVKRIQFEGKKSRKTDSLFVVNFNNIFIAKRFSSAYVVKVENGKFVAHKMYSVIGLIWRQMTWKTFGGFLITALAISLGAPFWFDLLNKIVAIRSSGKPDDINSPGNTPTRSSYSNIAKNKTLASVHGDSDTYKVTSRKEPDYDADEDFTIS